MKILMRSSLCFFVFLSSVSISFGQGMRPQNGNGPSTESAKVKAVTETGVVVAFGNAQGKEIQAGSRTQFVRMDPAKEADIKINASVVTIGPRRDSKVSARIFIIQGKAAGDAGMKPPDGAPAGRGPVIGTVVEKSPIKVKTSSGDIVTVELHAMARILRETPVGIEAFTVGDDVKFRAGKLILLNGKSPASSKGKVNQPPQGAMGISPDKWFSGSVISDDGPVSVKGRLPLVPKARENKFSKSLMKSKYGSAFGFKDPNMLRPDLTSWYYDFGKSMNTIGAYWMEAPALWTFRWNLVQGIKADGSYTEFYWERTDGMIKYAQSYNIHMCGKILTQEPSVHEQGRKAPALPKDMLAFRRFVRAVVERYDGDGVDDMPGLLYPVKRWKIEDEVMAPKYWGGSAHDYAVLLTAVYKEAKKADPGCEIIASMIRGYDGLEKDPVRFCREFFKALSGITSVAPYDGIDQHLMPTDSKSPVNVQYRRIQQMIDEVNSTAKKYGFAEKPIYSHEVAGDLSSERAQAIDMIKRHLYPFACGVRQVFWSGLKEAPLKGGGAYVENPQNSKFRSTTFIKDDNTKKLAYYSYKKMTEIIDGFDHKKTKMLLEKNGIYVIKFVKEGIPVWVAWCDQGKNRKIKIRVPKEFKRVYVTESLPSFVSGADVNDFEKAFKYRSVTPVGSVVELDLDIVPKYVEAAVVAGGTGSK